jgi:hypothetical protein
MLSQWRRWMADEDRYVEREAPDRRADLVVDAPTIEHDPVAVFPRSSGVKNQASSRNDPPSLANKLIVCH